MITRTMRDATGCNHRGQMPAAGIRKEINNQSKAINRMGYLAMAGLITITADNESAFQTGMAVMIKENEQNHKRQGKERKEE